MCLASELRQNPFGGPKQGPNSSPGEGADWRGDEQEQRRQDAHPYASGIVSQILGLLN
jgi:hypothetical protein